MERRVDRRRTMLGAAAALAPPPLGARAAPNGMDAGMTSFTSGGAKIAAEWFPAASPGPAPALLLLHGADGLALGEGYRLAARVLASSGFHVAFLHYLDRTRDRRVIFARIRKDYPDWLATIRDAVGWVGTQPGVDAARIGIVGVSLGAALAIDVASTDARVKALVDYFGPLPEGIQLRAKRLPPTLILHGQLDGVVGVEHAYAIETQLKRLGAPYEIHIYPDQGHGFIGTAQLDSAARVTAFLGKYLAAPRAG